MKQETINKPSRLNKEVDAKEREEREKDDGMLYIACIGAILLIVTVFAIIFK